MTTTAQSLITQASILLKDTDLDRWTTDELLFYLNEGQRQVVINDPASHVVTLPVLLSAGASQETPEDCNELIDISMNLGREWVTGTLYYVGQKIFEAGVRYSCLEAHTASAAFVDDATKWELAPYSSGTKIEEISEANMDQHYNVGWPVQSDFEDINYEPNVSAWVRKQGPDAYQNFFVTPNQPQTGKMYVEMVYSQIPAPILISDNITLRDKFSADLLDYILFRAYSKDMDNEANQAVAINYFNKFTNNSMKLLRRRR